MSARLVYLRLELKRACKKLPHIFAGQSCYYFSGYDCLFVSQDAVWGSIGREDYRRGSAS